jgi:hypothetical protein
LTIDAQPFTNDFPRADIHELIAPDLLHQVIKGTFKDHLVAWVEEYLIQTHGPARANEILDDIDHRSVDHSFTVFRLTHYTNSVLRLLLHFLVYGDSHRVEVSNNGLGMTLKP